MSSGQSLLSEEHLLCYQCGLPAVSGTNKCKSFQCLSEGDFHFKIYFIMKGFAQNSRDFKHRCTNKKALESDQPFKCLQNHTEPVADLEVATYSVYSDGWYLILA